MRLSTKLIATVGGFIAMGLSALPAQAVTVVEVGQSYDNLVFQGGSVQVSASASLLQFLNVNKILIQGTAPATVSESISTHPILGAVRTEVRVTSPATSVGIDDAGGIVSLTLTGGISLASQFRPGMSYGGALSIENLSINFTTKSIYATLTGDFRGVGTEEGYAPFGDEVLTTTTVPLWYFGNTQGDLAGGLQLIPQGTNFPVVSLPAFSLSNLTVTQQGHDHIISALRLHELGTHTLNTVTDYGVITSAVPEPSSTVLLMVGLTALGAAARIRRTTQTQQASHQYA